MTIENLLDQIDEMIDKAWGLPLSGGKCLVEADKLRDIIDDIRGNMPSEIRQAKSIVADRADIIATAKKEAEDIVRVAEERARALVDKEEIVKQAQNQANELLVTANTRAKEIKAAASEYADAIMKDCEDQLTASVNDVRATRQKLKARKG